MLTSSHINDSIGWGFCFKRAPFNKERQYSIHIFDNIIFFKCRTRQIIKTTETNK